MYICLCRIAEAEKEWAMNMKEGLAKKEQRIRALQDERGKMIAEVSTERQYISHNASCYDAYVQ